MAMAMAMAMRKSHNKILRQLWRRFHLEPVYIVDAGWRGEGPRAATLVAIAHCRLGELQNAKQRKITGRRLTHTQRERERERENILMLALPLRVARGGRGVGI